MNVTARLPALRMRRSSADRAIPQRLERVEQAADALMDKRYQKQVEAERHAQQRRDASERRDGMNGSPPPEGPDGDAPEMDDQEEAPVAARR
jgi:hypothetical protein